MATDSFFAIMCVSVIGLLFGSVLAFAGYRFFLILLPIWGFFFGFGLGAQAIQAIFGTGFLSDVTSWIVGFVVALVFAALSYLFYFAAVAILAGSLGYALGVGFMEAIGFDFGFLAWLVGVVLGIAVAAAVLFLNIQKWVIIIATALLGAGVIVGVFLFVLGELPPREIIANPVEYVLQRSWFWLLVFIVVAVLGFIAQYQSSKNWTLEEYSRMDEYYGATAPSVIGAPAQTLDEVAPEPPAPPAPTPPTTDTTAQGPTTPGT